MPSFIKVTMTGPLWDGQAQAAAREWGQATVLEVGAQGTAIIKSKAARMNKSGRGTTGAAAGHVTMDPAGNGVLIQGRSEAGVTWWPWLEGTSKRNQSTSFGGYHTFRRTRLILAKRWRRIAQERLAQFIGQMGGL